MEDDNFAKSPTLRSLQKYVEIMMGDRFQQKIAIA